MTRTDGTRSTQPVCACFALPRCSVQQRGQPRHARRVLSYRGQATWPTASPKVLCRSAMCFHFSAGQAAGEKGEAFPEKKIRAPSVCSVMTMMMMSKEQAIYYRPQGASTTVCQSRSFPSVLAHVAGECAVRLCPLLRWSDRTEPRGQGAAWSLSSVAACSRRPFRLSITLAR